MVANISQFIRKCRRGARFAGGRSHRSVRRIYERMVDKRYECREDTVDSTRWVAFVESEYQIDVMWIHRPDRK